MIYTYLCGFHVPTYPQYLEEHPDLTADALVEQIRAEVLDTTKISISAGIGPNAKVSLPISSNYLPGSD